MTPASYGARAPYLRGPSRSAAGAPARVAVVGGGPAGLFLARMIRLLDPGCAVDVYERADRDSHTGFGVSLSGRTMRAVAAGDPSTHARIVAAALPLSGLEMRLPEQTLRYDGFGLSAISRRALVTLLREQAEEAGARLHFGREVRADGLDADVVALADGAGSAHRTAGKDLYGTRVRTGAARYAWLGTEADFGDVTSFAFARTAYGPMAAHCYPYGEGMSTVVVETDEDTWRAAGLAGPSPEAGSAGEIGPEALGLLTEVFGEHLGGHKLLGGAGGWSRFRVVRNDRWSHGRTVLLGDAAHTAHFTVGSGTKLALEDALALATALCRHDTAEEAFVAYERERRPAVERTQDLADASMRWWETYGGRLRLPAAQFGFHFLTRIPAIGYLGLRRRCPERVDEAEAAYARQSAPETYDGGGNALGAPLRQGALRLPNRLVTVVDARHGDVAAAAAFPSAPPPGLTLVRHPRAVGGRSAAADGTRVLGTLVPAEDDLSAAPPEGPWFAELRCPEGAEDGAVGDALVRRAGELRARGVDGVVVRGDDTTSRGWYRALAYADRIRTGTGLPVAVYVPDAWALDLARDAAVDPWPTRIHVALVSGRVDLVATGGPAW